MRHASGVSVSVCVRVCVCDCRRTRRRHASGVSCGGEWKAPTTLRERERERERARERERRREREEDRESLGGKGHAPQTSSVLATRAQAAPHTTKRRATQATQTASKSAWGGRLAMGLLGQWARSAAGRGVARVERQEDLGAAGGLEVGEGREESLRLHGTRNKERAWVRAQMRGETIFGNTLVHGFA